MQERHFICYAWAERAGVTGNRAFALSEDGVIWETQMDKATYDGMKSIPPAGAAYGGKPFMSSIGGSDGNTWEPVGN